MGWVQSRWATLIQINTRKRQAAQSMLKLKTCISNRRFNSIIIPRGIIIYERMKVSHEISVSLLHSISLGKL